MRVFLSVVSLLVGGCSGWLYGQTAVTNKVKFSHTDNPVPAQTARDSYQGAGDFYHAQYTGSAWGDYNNDGYLDLFYSDRDEHVGSAIYANLYTNNCDGTFTRQSSSPFTGTAFSAPLWIDINNDGMLDMILPGLSTWGYNWADNETKLEEIVVNVYINKGPDSNGKYVFDKLEDHGIRPLFNGRNGGKGHNWISAGDYDNDGYIDIAMTGFDEHRRFYSDEPEEACRAVYLYHNNNGTGFQIQENPLGDSNFLGLTDGSVELKDIDGDGYLDLFTSGYGKKRTSETYIYWNNGNGTFTPDTNNFKGISDSSCTVYDLNNDGLADLIMPGKYLNTNSKTFLIYRNLGDRKFELIDNLDFEGVDGGQVSVGDVNNDGNADILIGGHGQIHEHTTWIYLNNGDFTFTTYGAFYNDVKGTNSFARVTHGSHHLVDYDNDGFLDAWMSGWVNGSCAKGCSALLYHNDSETKGATANQVPSAPEALSATIGENGNVLLSWNAPQDDFTPLQALRYNVYFKNVESNKISMIVPADINSGFIKVGHISGEISTRFYNINLPASRKYEWGVQAIDGNNAGGMFAKSSFTLESKVDKNIAEHDLKLVCDGELLNYFTMDYVASLEIFSITGAKVLSQEVERNGAVLLNFAPGIYVAILSNTNDSIKLKLIVR